MATGPLPVGLDSLRCFPRDPFKYFVSTAATTAERPRVVVGLGGTEPAEAPSRAGVVQVDHGAHQGVKSLLGGDVDDGIEQWEEGALEGAHSVFDGSVVLRVANGAVEREDASLGEEAIELFFVEGRSVVALEQ